VDKLSLYAEIKQDRKIVTLVTNSDMSELGRSSKRKLPSLDLILTSCACIELNDSRAVVER
jgi:hypothetical protein